MRGAWAVVGWALAVGFVSTAPASVACKAGHLTGGAAVRSDWRDDRPGLCREIRVGDLPAASAGHRNDPHVIKRPRGAWPKVPAGFSVKQFYEAGSRPRGAMTEAG